mgnify:CR=1 FL=1
MKSYKMKSHKMKTYQMKWYKGMAPSKKTPSKKGKSPKGHYLYGPSPYKGASPFDFRPKPTPHMTKGISPYRQPQLPTYSQKLYKPGAIPPWTSGLSSALTNQRRPNNEANGAAMKPPVRGASPFTYSPTPLPKPYYYYRGDDSGNRGIDVFVFGGA